MPEMNEFLTFFINKNRLPILYYLLSEDATFLLLEDAGKIVIGGENWGAAWVKGVKLALAYSKVSKPTI